MNLFKRLNDEKEIFKNELVFDSHYLPEHITGRERQIKEIALSIKPLLEGRKGTSLILLGSPGTGKTTTAKHVLSEFEKASSKVRGCYLNCWSLGTRYAVLSFIIERLGIPVSRRGRAADELLKYLTEEAKKLNGLVVVMDEIDMMVKAERNAVLYDLLRMKENFGVNLVLLMIANNSSFLESSERRVISSIAQRTVEFTPYTPRELKDILRERAKLGLLPTAWDEDIIGICAAFASKNGGDARIAITLLWLAGKEAELDSGRIEPKHVEKVKREVFRIIRESEEKNLSAEEKMVLEKIRSAGTIKSGDLYSELPMSDRAIRNYLNKLEELRFIESYYLYSKHGNTRIFRAIR